MPIAFIARLNALRQIIKNPQQATRQAIWGAIQGYVILWLFWAGLILTTSAIFGFTTVFGGPYEFFAWLFYFFVVVLAGVAVFSWWLYRRIKNKFRNFKNDFKKAMSHEADVIEINRLDY